MEMPSKESLPSAWCGRVGKTQRPTREEEDDRLIRIEEERQRLANNPSKCDNESRKSRIEVSILGHPGVYGRSGRRRPKK